MAKISMEEIGSMAQHIGIDLSEVDWDSIRLPPEEDFGIISDDEDPKEEDSLEFDVGFGNIVVVDNLPVVQKEKFEKLEGVIRKIYSQIGVMKDDKVRDQFVIRSGLDTEVLWNDARHLKPDPVYKCTFWTKIFVQWSPLGTYLATVHRQGAAVWGGATSFNRLMRYAHPQVKLIDFSPAERFLVTYSSHEPSNPRDTHKVMLNIFDVRTGKLMRDFKGSADDFAIGGTGGVTGVSWPIFKWGSGKGDKYFARIGKNVISVYETETFSLIDKKSIKVENVIDFSWSPTDPILALFVPELGGGNQTVRVSLVQIPNKEELRQKNLFSVSDCKMYWQSNGDYLAVKVDRYTKTKKSTYTGFELFRIKERDIRIEVLEAVNLTL